MVEHVFEKFLSKHASCYLACGPSEAYILKNRYKIPVKNIIFLPNLRTFEKIKTKEYKYQYIYVGRMVRDKGAFELLEAFKLTGCIKDVVLVGDGQDLDILKKQYPDARFTGRVTPEKVLVFLSVSKYFISNSVIEGLPYTLIEAMAYGVVPIVSNVEGHKDLVIDGKNGFLYNEPIDLVSSIFKSQLMSVNDYNQMKKSAKSTIASLSKLAKKNIKNNFKIYE